MHEQLTAPTPKVEHSIHQSTARPLGHEIQRCPTQVPLQGSIGLPDAECGQQTAFCSLRATSRQPSPQRAGAGVCLLLTFPFTLSLILYLI